uniref:uncharacterized protein LOC117250837 n=1 Tax=Epinephelus lanceolatus TaxID=310571 RepID=UPI0014467DF7|nr:uncharacterized protein LOC117250837 [Epinephelus lanceolatus]XP_033500524.1 uncharacterized protein LOC117268298 [Epinephelus lanceolatus]
MKKRHQPTKFDCCAEGHSGRSEEARLLPGCSGETGGHLASCVHGGEPGATSVTAGVFLGLIIGRTALGLTSGLNSAVTTATELVVNHKHQKEAGEVFQSFMEDVQSLQDCLEEVSAQPAANIPLNVQYLKVLSLLSKPVSVRRSIGSLVTDVSALQALRSDEQALRAGLVVVQEGQALRNVPRVASDLPDIGQATVKGPLALSKSARAGLIGLNALFLGMDIVFICKDSISLAKGSKTEISQLIRARAARWSSELDSWQKIHDSLSKGLQTSEKNKGILETPYYPEREVKTERKTETPSDEVDVKPKMKEKK